MELNKYIQRENPFKLSKFKKEVSLFMIRNQIQSYYSSNYFKESLITLNDLVNQKILKTEEKDLDDNIKILCEEFRQFKTSDMFEKMESNEKGVFSCLVSFVEQYIKTIKENNNYYNNQLISYELFLLSTDINELFNFSKEYFGLMLKNKKLSFDNLIKKEILHFEKKYGFKDIFFRKTLNIRDKTIMLKNLKELDDSLTKIAEDLDIPSQDLSLNGLISISFETIMFNYSSANAYMNKLDNHYIISLGRYKNVKELQEVYLHEFAHCLDCFNINNVKKLTYSEESLFNMRKRSVETPIEKIMQRELGFKDYHIQFKKNYANMQKEILELIKEEFKVTGELYIDEFQSTETINHIIDNYCNLDTYRLMYLTILKAIIDKRDYAQMNYLESIIMPEDKNSEKFKNIEEKIQLVRDKYNYILTKNSGFFLSDSKKELLEIDKKNKKQYYTNPLEIFARAFETYYKTKEETCYNFIRETKKEQYGRLLKKAINEMLGKNEIKYKRKLK